MSTSANKTNQSNIADRCKVEEQWRISKCKPHPSNPNYMIRESRRELHGNHRECDKYFRENKPEHYFNQFRNFDARTNEFVRHDNCDNKCIFTENWHLDDLCDNGRRKVYHEYGNNDPNCETNLSHDPIKKQFYYYHKCDDFKCKLTDEWRDFPKCVQGKKIQLQALGNNKPECKLPEGLQKYESWILKAERCKPCNLSDNWTPYNNSVCTNGNILVSQPASNEICGLPEGVHKYKNVYLTRQKCIPRSIPKPIPQPPIPQPSTPEETSEEVPCELEDYILGL